MGKVKWISITDESYPWVWLIMVSSVNNRRGSKHVVQVGDEFWCDSHILVSFSWFMGPWISPHWSQPPTPSCSHFVWYSNIPFIHALHLSNVPGFSELGFRVYTVSKLLSMSNIFVHLVAELSISVNTDIRVSKIQTSSQWTYLFSVICHFWSTSRAHWNVRSRTLHHQWHW